MAEASNSKPAGNGFDVDAIMSVIHAHEELDAQCATIMGEAKNKCKGPRNDQKELLDELKQIHGIKKSIPKAILAKRKYLRKIQKTDEEIEEELKSDLDQIEHSIGMPDATPLFDWLEGKGAADDAPEAGE